MSPRLFDAKLHIKSMNLRIVIIWPKSIILKYFIIFYTCFLLGPAAYNPVLRKSCSIPLFVKASKRFKDSKEITPGPATYEVCQW